MFEPYYGYHEHTFISLDLVPVYAKLSPPNWDYNLDELEHLVTPKTRAIMINTPSNPCGKVYSEKELNELADLVAKGQEAAIPNGRLLSDFKSEFTSEKYEQVVKKTQEYIKEVK